MAGGMVRVKQTALNVYILDAKLNTVVTHKRLYGDQKESMDWLPYLSQLSKRPGALKHTPIYKMLPQNLQQHLNASTKSDCGKILKTIAELTKHNGFKKAIDAVEKTLERGVKDTDSIVATFNRLYSLNVVVPKIRIPEGLPKLPANKHSGSAYDSFMHRGEQ